MSSTSSSLPPSEPIQPNPAYRRDTLNPPSSAVDVSPEAQTERALRESQDRLRSAVESAPIILFALDLDGVITFSEGKGLTALGLKSGELVGSSVFDLYTDRPDILSSIRRAIRGESFMEIAEVEGVVFETRWTPQYGADGALTGTIGVSTDITERRRAELALRTNEGHFRQAISAAGAVPYYLDYLTSRYAFMGEGILQLTGYTVDEMHPGLWESIRKESHPLGELAGLDPVEAARRARAGEIREWKCDLRIETRSGETRWLNDSSSILVDEQGRSRGAIGILQDVTERKLLLNRELSRQAWLEKVLTLGTKIYRETDLQACLLAINTGIRTDLEFDRVGVFLYDAESALLRGAFGTDAQGKPEDTSWYSLPIDHDQTLYQVFQDPRGLLFIHDYTAHHKLAPDNEMYGVKEHLTVTAWAGDKPVAILVADNKFTGRRIAEEQIEALRIFAGYVGLAIENARLYTAAQHELAERKDAEARLTQFRTLIDQSHDAIYVIDALTSRYLDFNTKAYESLGYTAEELAGLGVVNVALHVPSMQVWERRVQLVRESGGLVFETIYRRKDGTVFPVEVSARMMEHDQQSYMVVGVRDLTERKQVEEQLQANRRAEAQFLEQLVTLQEVTNQLSKASTFDDICRQAVELAHTRLGFSRTGIWFADRARKVLSGSFGIDESGQIRDERDQRIKIEPNDVIWNSLQGQQLVVRYDDMDLFDDRHVRVGHGTSVTAALWDGDEIIGFVSSDNLLTQQPFTEQQCEILGLFASAVGHLCSRKRAEEARQKAEEKYRNIFDNIIEGIYQTTPAGQYVTVNAPLARMMGFATPEDMMSRITDLNRQLYVLSGRREEFKQQMAAHGSVTGFESEIYREDGSTFWVSENAHCIYDDKGNLLYYEGTTEDITARKRAEEALRTAEENYRSIFENAVEGIYQTTPDGRILSVNPALARLLGYESPDELVSTITDIPRQFYVRPELRDVFTRRILEQGEVKGMEYEVLRKDGRKIWVSDNARAVYGTGAVPLYFEGFITDITDRKQAEEKIELQVRRLEALHAIDTAISSSLDLHFTLNVLLEQVTKRMGIDAADVLLLDPDTYVLEFAAGSGFRGSVARTERLELGDDSAGTAVLERRVVTIPSLSADDKLMKRTSSLWKENFASYCAVPLVSKGKVKGVLEIFQRRPFEMDRDWLGFLETLAGQTALAIEDSALFHDLEHTNIELTLAYDATIEGWSRALDLRDRETEGHTKRVTDITLRLARALGMSEADLVHIRRGALLHDIGKMGIPDAILSKAGPLTQKEKLQMREHPNMAYEMLRPITFLRPALDIPYCHHEKWDGSGYPQGLSGEKIPIAARIFAVVDVWDALRSDRPYRKRWPEKKVRSHIRAQAGKYFDPKIVEAFLGLGEL